MPTYDEYYHILLLLGRSASLLITDASTSTYSYKYIATWYRMTVIITAPDSSSSYNISEIWFNPKYQQYH